LTPIEVLGGHICSKCLRLGELRLRVEELESELQTLRHIRNGEGYLDCVFREVVTPNRVVSSNLIRGQGQDGVTTSEEGKGTHEVEMEESRSLLLSNRFEALTPCVEGSGDCSEDEQTDHGTVERGAIQVGGGKQNVAVIGDSIVRGIDTVLCSRERAS